VCYPQCVRGLGFACPLRSYWSVSWRAQLRRLACDHVCPLDGVWPLQCVLLHHPSRHMPRMAVAYAQCRGLLTRNATNRQSIVFTGSQLPQAHPTTGARHSMRQYIVWRNGHMHMCMCMRSIEERWVSGSVAGRAVPWRALFLSGYPLPRHLLTTDTRTETKRPQSASQSQKWHAGAATSGNWRKRRSSG